ncbi:pullulanase-type alpha-1,6-glucosidase [Actinomyces respiraculi]|uniref:Pullulanase-type alpha-1,6-glucosidase n=1 Tax=Actinomyces respiraculi TaxID=2744574 RepID=A0A7T0PY44_9ACTO|nr:pullulanase-type alpha-1,6-glucosidase [Actinomyces respiraculi]
MQALHALRSIWSCVPIRSTHPGRAAHPPRLVPTHRHPWARALTAAVATLALVGASLNSALSPTAQAADEATPGLQVTVPGSHNDEMGCATDWAPDCTAATLTRDALSGLYTATFDLPAGTYDYKVTIGATWDENYGANGAAGGANITYTTGGGPVTFFYDPVSHVSWTDATTPYITLPGSFQDELGCPSDWTPDCLATLMRPAADGTFTFTTAALPTGSYEVKVAHGRSWDENYGVDGAPGGTNYTFSATTGKDVTFTYDPATHLLSIAVADPPVAGTGEERAYWVDETTLAWPTSLLPESVTRDQAVAAGTPAAVSFALVTSPDGGAGLSDGTVTGGTETPLRVSGDLSAGVLANHPNLTGYLALSLTGADGTTLLSRSQVEQALSGQVAVVERRADGTVAAFTGVQNAAVIDSLFTPAPDAPLGTTFSDGVPSFALWAPTAQSVTLLTWATGQATGSAPLVAGQAVRTQAVRGSDGRWSVANTDGAITAGSQYLWEVTVYVPDTGRVETNTVTDPYSLALTMDSQRSVAVDLSRPDLMPQQWAQTASPVVTSDAGRTIYELHVRDFSAADTSVPEAERGTYLAFTHPESAGMTHLAELAEAGIDTVHLLPTFDIASIGEDRSHQQVPDIPTDAGPASEAQQAAVAAVRDADAYNWGYDPWHYRAPEGSYATDGNQDGGARTYQFRQMVGALHAAGLQVVLDQVFNHTAAAGQSPASVLDRIVPGYYQRLDAKGDIFTSTCCSNTATENTMAERLMIDSVVTWARDYHVDGFRFDLMGYHSVQTMQALRTALDKLTLETDGVDGSAIYLYGEGWNMGEIANNALFTTATQGQLNGTGIGTFNDRLRDAVHGGGPFDQDPRTYQGFGTGLYTDPNGMDPRSSQEQLADLGHATDLIKLGLAGNLSTFTFTNHDGTVRSGAQIDYNGQPAGYASSPEETINYVDAHDNESLYDLGIFKLPTGTSVTDRVRMNTLSLATVALGQSPTLWAAGTEILRSKSLDRDSYNSGDHFNAIDWTYQTNGYGNGLPVASANSSKWDIMRPLLEDPTLKPSPQDIATSQAQVLDLLRIRSSTPLFHLGSAELIQERVSFPNSGQGATPGVIAMLIEDRPLPGAGIAAGTMRAASTSTADIDPQVGALLAVFNATDEPVAETITDLQGRQFVLHSVQAEGADPVVRTSTFDAATGTATVPARTVAVYVEVQKPAAQPTPEPSAPSGDTPGADTSAQSGGTSTKAPAGDSGTNTVAGASQHGGESTTLARTGAGDLVLLWVLCMVLVGAGVSLRHRRA